MKTVLLITSSLNGSESKSTELAEKLIEQLRDAHGELSVHRRDLAGEAVPHLDDDGFSALSTPEDDRNPAQQRAAARSRRYIEELRSADLVVLAVPMYNFGVPSTFKAWYDHVARAGVTFEYTREGPRGLLDDRPVYVLSTRGGRYAGTPADLHTPYLTQILNFIGLEDLQFVYAEGLGSSDAAEASMDSAKKQIGRLAA